MHTLFDRNIRNSLLVTGGEFEEALANIIDQLEHPPVVDGSHLAAWQTARMIAEAMGEGFAGLPPNGFDFSCWLWETAPLYVVSIPQANIIGTSHGFRYGVVHLRKIAAMLAATYVQQQPLKVAQVIELIDLSLDWVDARNLIIYALLEHYDQYFQRSIEELSALASSAKTWRRLIPLGVAARIVGTRPADSAEVYALLRLSSEYADDPQVYQGLRYVLRIAGMYGSRKDLLDFLSALRHTSEPLLQALVCDFLRNPRLEWDHESRQQIIEVLLSWTETTDKSTRIPCIEIALRNLQSLVSLA
ncbi:MAG: hypothetical protein WC824_09575 [Bacteroidota bacterium]